MKSLKERSLEEYCSATTTAHHGGEAGRPFWNVQATQFMYNPCFQFPLIPGSKRYLFTATDCNEKIHTFEADSPMSLLTPIWRDLPEGFVNLKVEALDQQGNPWVMAGVRTFYKCAPFPGRDAYPPRARTYREAALMAYRYVFNQSFVQYWLEKGSPDPDYDLNVYPSKTYSAVINAMLLYAKLDSEHARQAIELAVRVADYMISITFPEGSPLEGLPPTYYVAFREDLSAYDNETAVTNLKKLMMIYPANAGLAYLALEEVTGEKRFFEAAKKIAEYYRRNVQPNGSWHLLLSIENGQSISNNYCVPNVIMKFMNKMYERTGETAWQQLEQGCYDYIKRTCMDQYNWEGQFEDAPLSTHYSNLTHFVADSMIGYIAANKHDDPQAIAEAEDMMRFVEDQFVVWGQMAPWNHRSSPKHGDDISQWFSPAGLEQYKWYMPIDSSTARITEAFLDLYSVKKDPLLLEKAFTLGDMLTRMQNPKTGMIPTHWTRKTCIEDGGNLWINCLIVTANALFRLAEWEEKQA